MSLALLHISTDAGDVRDGILGSVVSAAFPLVGAEHNECMMALCRCGGAENPPEATQGNQLVDQA